ncbi:hypothetical protein [Bacillus sp. FJAT-29814]|uniref:hypothetical protein n=1 Tax=Bacillus sp. FJAT-29814 TaxID=1729688 RepID=UPI000831A653|nr:hypothetical protein [Bacillus sp. FJAT-29814]
MKKLKYWRVAAVIGLLIGIVYWWATSLVKDLKDPLNKADVFVYSDNGILHWFELTSRSGKVKGKLHQLRLIEKVGKAPSMEEKIYPVTGETTKKGYTFVVNKDGNLKSYEAWFSGPHLSVRMQVEQDSILYNPVNQEELSGYVKALKDYNTEEKENKQRRQFFDELRSVIGFLYVDENDLFKLFIKIDEALIEGELTGSLLMMDSNGKETRYALKGITDGQMLRLFATVNGETTKLEGHFHEGAAEFDLSFWTADKKLTFHAVTEKEFNQSYEKQKNNSATE